MCRDDQDAQHEGENFSPELTNHRRRQVVDVGEHPSMLLHAQPRAHEGQHAPEAKMPQLRTSLASSDLPRGVPASAHRGERT